MYGTYAVGLFFGAYRVAAGAYTGGTVLQVLIATLMGGFSLGQVSATRARDGARLRMRGLQRGWGREMRAMGGRRSRALSAGG